MSSRVFAPETSVGRGSLLRFALRLDAIVSGISGVVLLVTAPTVSEVLGMSTALLWAVGLATLVYAVALVRTQRRRLSAGAGWLIVAVNTGWAVASVLLAMAGWMPLTGTGTAVVLAQAVVVAALAELQFMAVRRLVG